MNAKYDLKLILEENAGWITLKEVEALGISRQEFYRDARHAGLEKAGRGVYIAPDAWPDSMFLLHLRSSQIVFSHESALFLHGMTEREPLRHFVTVRTGYNPHRLQEDGIKVYLIKKELYELGLTQAETSFGHLVPVYDPERTICDIVRSRNNVDKQVFQDALKAYGRRRDKNMRNLMRYSELLQVKKILKPYLEVLL